MFDPDEIIGKEVCITLHDGEIVSGILDHGSSTYIVLRNERGEPYLFHERYVVSLFLKPEGLEVENDNT